MSVTPIQTEPASVTATVRRVSLGSIFVGAIVTLAMMVFFATLGLAIGASTVDPLYDRDPLDGLGIGAGIYLLVSQLISLAAGGFAAARLAGFPLTISSLLHGLAVWALATLLLAWTAIAGAGAMFGAASNILGKTASGAASVLQAATPDDLSFPDLSEIASRVSMEDLPPDVRQALVDRGITPDQLRNEARGAFRDVVSQQEQERAINILESALADMVRSPGNIEGEIDQAVERLFTGPDAVFSQSDREEAAASLRNRLGLEQGEVDQIIQSVETRIDTARNDLRMSLERAQQQALETAQTATSVIATTAMWLTIASLLGLAAALAGAAAGKPDGFLGDRLDSRFHAGRV